MKYHIVFNKGFCSKCHEDLQSWHRHDFVTCSCGESSLDGGLDYVRTVGKTQSTAVTTEDPFPVIRKYMYRGGYGATGQGPFRYTKLMNMDNDYLKALLSYEKCPEWQKLLVKQEIEYRKNHDQTTN